MPAATILGGDEPGTLGAFGPIAAEDARRLAGLAASFTLVVTHDGSPPDAPEPTTVVPVAVTDGRQYRIPAPLRRALATRDITCRFPGCRAVAARCDVDHVEAWAAGGPTEAGNLAHLCRKHHVLKHHSAWIVEAEPASGRKRSRPLPPRTVEGEDAYESEGRERTAERLTWTSPAGRQYVTAPEPPPF